MKFDKINFVLSILSSNVIIANAPNTIKLFIVDSISGSEISKVEFSIGMREGRNAIVFITPWQEIPLQGNFYQDLITPIFTKESTLSLGVRITDEFGGIYYLEENLKGVLV